MAYTPATKYVDTAGDTMTGPLLLSGDPTLGLHAATRQYTTASHFYGTWYATSLPSGAATIMTGWNVQTADLGTASNQFIYANRTGYYAIGVNMRISGAGGIGAGQRTFMSIIANSGSSIHRQSFYGAGETYFQAATVVYMSVDQYIYFDFYHQIGSTVSIAGGAAVVKCIGAM